MLAIVGPTASGKTGLALAIAERLDAEIVSCDSMQIYRGFDIGTAKPTAAERARARHHLVDVADPDESFSAASFVEHADRAIAEIGARGRRVLVVGGTGLYLRALRFGLVAAPARDDALRARLLDEEHARPGSLHLRLRAVDPASAGRLAPRDLVRVVRALEVHELTGVPLSEHFAAQQREPRHPLRVAVLDPPAEDLEARIAARAEVMVAGGLVEETRKLLGRYGETLRPLGAVGYRQAVALLRGELAVGELTRAIAMATRRYARRQRTWFRGEPEVERFVRHDTLLEAADRLCNGCE